jgi:beta-N-acetylhexosaminidase
LLTEIVRGELGFDGVITTDALEMRAVADRWGIGGAAVRSLAAGADALLIGVLDGERYCAEIRAAVADAVRAGELPLERLEEAAARVAALASWAAEPRAGAMDAREVGLEAARRALRAQGRLPLAAPPFVVELRDRSNLAVGAAHWSLADQLAERAFLAGAAEVRNEADALPDDGGAPLVVVCRDAYRSSWQQRRLAAVLADRPDAVVVALGLPDDRVLAGETFLAAHGAGRSNLEAVAERLHKA